YHFNQDRFRRLIERLSHLKEDEELKRAARHRIPIDGNVHNGARVFSISVADWARAVREAGPFFFDHGGGPCAIHAGLRREACQLTWFLATNSFSINGPSGPTRARPGRFGHLPDPCSRSWLQTRHRPRPPDGKSICAGTRTSDPAKTLRRMLHPRIN